MIVNINEIIYYGRHYKEEKNRYRVLWWFCLTDYQVYSTNDLIEQYSFPSFDDIADSDDFIPMFKTDITEVEKGFMRGRNEYEFGKIRESHTDYDVAFRIYIEKNFLTKAWYEYEKKALLHDAVLWCKRNNLPYTEKDVYGNK